MTSIEQELTCEILEAQLRAEGFDLDPPLRCGWCGELVDEVNEYCGFVIEGDFGSCCYDLAQDADDAIEKDEA